MQLIVKCYSWGSLLVYRNPGGTCASSLLKSWLKSPTALDWYATLIIEYAAQISNRRHLAGWNCCGRKSIWAHVWVIDQSWDCGAATRLLITHLRIAFSVFSWEDWWGLLNDGWRMWTGFYNKRSLMVFWVKVGERLCIYSPVT